MKTLLLTATSALAVLVAGTTLAQTAPGRGLRADADNDGRISKAEFVDARIARLTAVDANRDGSVSVEERRSGRDTRRNQRLSNRFETLDRDGNGALSREEFTAVVTRADGAPRQGRRAAWRAMRAERMAERAGSRGPVSIADARTRVEQAFDRLDADRDGYVTVEERREQRQARRDARPSPSQGS